MFHVSMLRKYVLDPSPVLSYEPIKLHNNLSYEETLIKILYLEVRELHNKIVPLVKVIWRNHTIEKATWENEEKMQGNRIFVV